MTSTKFRLRVLLIHILIVVVLLSIIMCINVFLLKGKGLNTISIIILIIVLYLIFTIYPSIMYYYYGVYYLKYGLKIVYDSIGGMLVFLLSGYYCILFYINKNQWFANREKMLEDRKKEVGW